MKNIALVLSGLLAGTLAGALLVPRVLAEGPRPAPVPPAKWQQFCEPASSIAEASSMAGARGVEGWELVGFFGGALCFKRPAVDRPSAGVADRPSAGAADRPSAGAADRPSAGVADRPSAGVADRPPAGGTSWPGY
jgi:hypothetical protein